MPVAKPKAFNPNELRLDDGRVFDSPTGSPALFGVGLQQIAGRRAEEDRYEAERQRAGIGLNFNVGGRLAGGPLPSMWDDAFYGLMQAKENAVNASGKRLNVTPNNVSEGAMAPNLLRADLYSREVGPDRNTADPDYQEGIDIPRTTNQELNARLRSRYAKGGHKSTSNAGFASGIIGGLRSAYR